MLRAQKAKKESDIIRQHFGLDVTFELSNGPNTETGRPDAWVKIGKRWQLVEVKDRGDRLQFSQRQWFFKLVSMTGKSPWILWRNHKQDTMLFKSVYAYDFFWSKGEKYKRLCLSRKDGTKRTCDGLKRLNHICAILSGPTLTGAYTVRVRCLICKNTRIVNSIPAVLKRISHCQPCGISESRKPQIAESIQKIHKLPFVIDKVTQVGDGKRFEAKVRCPRCRQVRTVRQGVAAFMNYSGRCKGCALSMRGRK
jgi:hypothetical protein